MAKHSAKKEKMEFSKVLALSTTALWYLVVLGSFALMFISMDLSPLMYLIPAAAGHATLVHNFYTWKARAENTIKLKSIYGKDTTIPPYTESTNY